MRGFFSGTCTFLFSVTSCFYRLLKLFFPPQKRTSHPKNEPTTALCSKVEANSFAAQAFRFTAGAFRSTVNAFGFTGGAFWFTSAAFTSISVAFSFAIAAFSFNGVAICFIGHAICLKIQSGALFKVPLWRVSYSCAGLLRLVNLGERSA